ncbi:MAG: hypothetical protein KF889_08645 [Alphaproteobacteria bacterium]|nr:hypothetical protein [Alphaproteobacteria bacterium]MCW5740889.1 hypothetical protein [Alphaproteobacteria bacterium]
MSRRRAYRFAALDNAWIHVDSDAALEPFHRRFLALWPMVEGNGAPPDIVIQALADDLDAYVLRHPALPEGSLRVASAEEAANQIVSLLVAEAIERSPRLVSLHAGAARVGDGLIVLPGDSMSGKSTLSLQLAARGARFVADDRLLVGDGAALGGEGGPAGVALGLTPRVRLPIHPAAGADYIAFIERHMTVEHHDEDGAAIIATVDPQSIGGAPFGEIAPLSAIVVPRRVEGDESALDLRPLPRGQAALALLRQAATPAVDAAELVGMMGSLAAGVTCWSLAYGSSARAADRLMRPLGG